MFLDFRLHHIFDDALYLRMLGCYDTRVGSSQSKSLPNGLVRRKSNNSDLDHPRHTHEQDSFRTKLGILAPAGNFVPDHAHRYCHTFYSSWRLPWLYVIAEFLLATFVCVSVVLRFADTSRENVATKEKVDIG